MTDTSDGGKAFPGVYLQNGPFGNLSVLQSGMTLRDWFAGQALMGMMCNTLILSLGPPMGGESMAEFCAVGAYDYADAMLKERERER